MQLYEEAQALPIGQRMSPHEWLMSQIPNDTLAQHVKDATFGILYTALQMAANCAACESIRVVLNSDPKLEQLSVPPGSIQDLLESVVMSESSSGGNIRMTQRDIRITSSARNNS